MNVYKIVDINGDTYFYLLSNADRETVEKTSEFVKNHSFDGCYDPSILITVLGSLGYRTERVDTIQASIIEF